MSRSKDISIHKPASEASSLLLFEDYCRWSNLKFFKWRRIEKNYGNNIINITIIREIRIISKDLELWRVVGINKMPTNDELTAWNGEFSFWSHHYYVQTNS